jgi:hypothetical protein
MTTGEERAAAALAAAGIQHVIVRHGPVTSLAEAAQAQGVTPDRGAHGVSATVSAADLIRVLGATVAAVTDPV